MVFAQSRLEELYLEHAKTEATLEAYDAYLERFPEGNYLERGMEEREHLLLAHATSTNTVEAWELYLAQYPRAPKKVKKA